MPDQDVTVEVIGGAEAMADLRRWADQLGPAVAAKGQTLGEQLAGRVRGKVPVLTGALADTAESTATPEGFTLQLGGDLPYAGWIEFGGSRGRPYVSEGRYLYPTAQEGEPEFLSLADDTADDTIGRFSWSTPSAA